MDFVKQRWDTGPKDDLTDLAADIVREIDSFANFATQRDDITFILARTGERVAPSAPEPVHEEIDIHTLRSQNDGTSDS